MPHIESLDEWDWPATCRKLASRTSSPTADSKETITRISSLDKLVTEAMHGAIVADSLRVPWVAVALSDRSPRQVVRLVGLAGAGGAVLEGSATDPPVRTKGRPEVPRARCRLSSRPADQEVHSPPSTSREIAFAEWTLRSLVSEAPVQLSADAKLRALRARFTDGLARLRDKSKYEPESRTSHDI